ncbi:nucleotidyltransferase domain-containing protein [bacterium]|nr:MAG: nucleotidyltransferase domain-containing protein [bacterium]
MEKREEILKRAKQAILKTLEKENVRVKKIVLFGSRARGMEDVKSDWDFLIVTENAIPIQIKMKLTGKLLKALAKERIPADVILKSEEEVEYYKNYTMSVVKEAIKTGTPI